MKVVLPSALISVYSGEPPFSSKADPEYDWQGVVLKLLEEGFKARSLSIHARAAQGKTSLSLGAYISEWVPFYTNCAIDGVGSAGVCIIRSDDRQSKH
jgi:hypothetical protein